MSNVFVYGDSYAVSLQADWQWYNYLYYLPIVGNEKKCAGILNEFTATNFTKPLSWSAYDGLAYQFSFDEQKVNTLFYLSKKLQVPNSLKFLFLSVYSTPCSLSV